MGLTKEKIIEKMNSFGLPEYMQEGVVRYIFDYIMPGNFLEALLANDLSRSVSCADMENSSKLKDWVCFIYNTLPSNCWGSYGIIQDWIEKGQKNDY
jgi:hypothetical protein